MSEEIPQNRAARVAAVAEGLNIDESEALERIVAVGAYMILNHLEGVDFLQGSKSENDWNELELMVPERRPGNPKLRIVK